MKRSQVGVSKIGVVNSDGHAIGLDLGATEIRAAILAPGTHEGRPSVTAHGLGAVALPVGTIVNGAVMNAELVAQAVRRLWADNKFECRHVVLGTTSQQGVVRPLNMPNLPAAQLRQALPYQAREIVPIPLEQALLDFIPLGPPDSATEMIRGLLVAMPRQPILNAVRAVEKGGVKVARVDLSPFAALRAGANSADAVEAIIDLGAHLTSIVVHHQGVIRVVRTIPRGGQELTSRVSDRASLEPEDAEKAKLAVGLLGQEREVRSALSEAVRPLIAEIRSSINYFSSTNANTAVERICLTGRASRLLGLSDLLSDQLGVPCEHIEAMQHIRNRYAPDAKRNSNEEAASAVSVGLAMGAAA